MVKWIREWTTDPEVGVQVQMSKKEILEYSVKCVVEGLGMRVWTFLGGIRPPRKTKPLFF